MIQLLHQVTQALLHFFDVHQLPALFVLLLLEEAGIPIPIPGDTLIMLAGTQSHTKLLRESILVVCVSCIATILGSSVLFGVMRRGGAPVSSQIWALHSPFTATHRACRTLARDTWTHGDCVGSPDTRVTHRHHGRRRPQQHAVS